MPVKRHSMKALHDTRRKRDTLLIFVRSHALPSVLYFATQANQPLREIVSIAERPVVVKGEPAYPLGELGCGQTVEGAIYQELGKDHTCGVKEGTEQFTLYCELVIIGYVS